MADCVMTSRNSPFANDIERFYETSYAKEYVWTSEKYSVAHEFLKDCKRVLDIGCGDGSFLASLKESSSDKEVYGVEISKEAVSVASSKGIHASQLDVGREKFPFPDDFFDGIFCGEVIEHLYDPDHLLDEARRVLKGKGLFLLTTPNLASWYNRLFLLVGYQPLFTEVSLKHGVGHPFAFWVGAGHIRIFTLRALRELVLLHRLKVMRVVGFGINPRLGYGKRWSGAVRVFNKVFSRPSLSSDIMLVMTK